MPKKRVTITIDVSEYTHKTHPGARVADTLRRAADIIQNVSLVVGDVFPLFDEYDKAVGLFTVDNEE